MNEAEYNAAEGIRRSDLWKIHDSPEKYHWAITHPDESEPTPALVFGQAAHKILLEPNDFTEEFAVAPDGIDKRTKDGKAQWADFLASNAGKTVIDRDTFNQCLAMSEKAMSDPTVAKLLAGRKEVPFFWDDPDTGVRCKVKIDCLTYLEGMEIPVIVDYKTTKSAAMHDFQRDVYQFGYHLQAAMYTEGVMRNLKLTERPMFVFVVQEKTEPFSLNVITVPEDVMNFGLDTFRELLGIYKACSESGNWYGYTGFSGQPNELTLPAWLKKESESNE